MATAPKTEDLRSLIGRFDPACIHHFQGATNLCVARTQYEVTPDHLLMRMLDETTGDVAQIFNTFKVDRSPLRQACLRVLDALRIGHRAKPALSPKLVELFQSAAVMTDEFGMHQIRSGTLLLAMVLNPPSTMPFHSA